MPNRYRRFRDTLPAFPLLIAVAMLAASVPRGASAQINPQGDPDVGAITYVAPYDDVIAYIQGKKIKFTDGVQNLFEFPLFAKSGAVIQPNGMRTYVVDTKMNFYVFDSSNKNSITLIDYDEEMRPEEKIKDFKMHNDSTFVATTASNKIYTYTVRNGQVVNVQVQSNAGDRFDSHAGDPHGVVLNGGFLHIATLEAAGYWTLGPGVDTGGAVDVAAGLYGTVVTCAGSEVTSWDISGATPVQTGTQDLGGILELEGIIANSSMTDLAAKFWVAADEAGSKLIEEISVDCQPGPGCVITTGNHNYSTLQGELSMAINYADPSTLAIARGTGFEVWQSNAPFLVLLQQVIGLAFVHKLMFASILGTPHLYASGGFSGLWIWGMTDPLFPFFLGDFFGGFQQLLCFQMYVPTAANQRSGSAVGPYGVGGVDNGFTMYDLSDPTSPSFVDRLSVSIGTLMHDLVVIGDYAYGAAGTDGLKIANLTTPSNMTLTQTVATPSEARHIVIAGNHAYVGTTADGVRIVDVSVPASASEVGSVGGASRVTSLATDNSYLYVGSDSTMSIYDLSTPTAPAFTGSYELDGQATVEGIGIVDVPGGMSLASESAATKLAYIAAGDSGFVILDVSDPSTPLFGASEPSRDFASSVAVDGNDVYLGDGGAGFLIFDVDPTTVPVFFETFDVTSDGHAVEIAWNLSADEGLAGFQIFRSSGPGVAPLKVHAEELLSPKLRWYRDDTVEAGRSYEYTLVVRTLAGETYQSPHISVNIPPRDAELFPGYPNPFNPRTTIAFDLPRAGRVRLAVHDAAGRRVVTLLDGIAPAGRNKVEWAGIDAQGQPVSSGIYFVRLEVGSVIKTIKVTLLK